MKHPSKPCWRWKRRVALLGVGALTRQDAEQVLNHVTSCAGCQSLLRQMESLSAHLEDFGRQLPTAQPTGRLRELWQTAIAARLKPAPDDTYDTDTPAGLGWITEWLPGGRRTWPAIASCWVAILLLHVLAPRVNTPTASPAQLPLRDVLSVLQTTTWEARDLAQPDRPAPTLRHGTSGAGDHTRSIRGPGLAERGTGAHRVLATPTLASTCGGSPLLRTHHPDHLTL